MRSTIFVAALRTSALGLSIFIAASAAADDAADLLEQAARADRPERAIELAGQAIESNPDFAQAYAFRGEVLSRLRRPAEAEKDFSRWIELAPATADAYYLRGRARFCAGKIAESITDFDMLNTLRPDTKPQQWERGIALYYAGRFDDGAAQFALYQTFHDNDVENATWRYLCMARSVGVEKARKELLPIKNDTRVPMMQIYALYRGEATPDDVLRAARLQDPKIKTPEQQLNDRLFYAHLYLGLYHEAAGDAARAKEHIKTAAEKHKIAHYMWDVANVHAQRLK